MRPVAVADPVWGPVEAGLEAALEAAALRQRAIAHNLANAETPGYARFEVVFEQALAARHAEKARRRLSLARTHPVHMPGPLRPPVRPMAVRDTTSLVRNDRSNVDMEREMAALSKNQLWHDALLRTLGARIGALQAVISEGRR